MPDAIELVMRGGAATTFLLLGVILLRDGGNRTLSRLGVLFSAGTAWWALNTEPFSGWSDPWALPLVVVSFGNTVAFWLFSRALFEDDFKLKRSDWALWFGMTTLGAAWYFSRKLGFERLADPLRIVFQLGQVFLASSAAWAAWRGRSVDLVEPRRRARAAFVVLSSVMMICVTLSYLAHVRGPHLVIDPNVLRLFVMAVGMTLLVAGLRSEVMFSSLGHARHSTAGEGGGVVVCTDPAEARLLSRLLSLMEEERTYRQEGLTIGALASRAGVPEYALRRLINGRLGYRNFNAYLNGWRLADVKAALRDPSQREVPISIIALDAGFNSLGPFNRAFKAAEGVTPSEFRAGPTPEQAIAAGSPITKSA